MTTVNYPIELLETSRLMRTQDNRGTQYPLFVVQEELEVGKPDGCGENSQYWSDEYATLTVEQYDELERAQDGFTHDTDVVKDALEAIGVESVDDIDLGDWRKVDYDIEPTISDRAGFFFTEAACELHIRQNHYHYTKPRSYVISAWRNPEMVMVMQTILMLTGEEIPSHYK